MAEATRDMPSVPIPGVDKAWEELSVLDPEATARRTGAQPGAGGKFLLLPVFGATVRVDLARREIEGFRSELLALPGNFEPLFRLAIPWYLVHAKDLEPTGDLIRPDSLPGGGIFSRGTHVLPTEALAKKFGSDPDGFRALGSRYGGRETGYGDVAMEMRPLPRIPITVILWTADDEFPARSDLLLDSTARFQAPVDVLWAVALMTVEVFLNG